MPVILMRPDDEDFRTILYASEHVLKGYKPQVGDSIRGVLWLQGYPLRPVDDPANWGDRLTDSDVRLFQTLSSFERNYRPGFVDLFGQQESIQISDFPHLWAYARDLFQHGLADEREKYCLGLVPGPSGEYIDKDAIRGNTSHLPSPEESLAAWNEPSGRENLTGSSLYTGPGGGGSYELWSFGQ